jgi:hypothetical protein
MRLWLEGQDHQVPATDISTKMVEHTAINIREANLDGRMTARQMSMQEALQSGQRSDLICIHALLEWQHEPYTL